MDLISLLQEHLCKKITVLTAYSRDYSYINHDNSLPDLQFRIIAFLYKPTLRMGQKPGIEQNHLIWNLTSAWDSLSWSVAISIISCLSKYIFPFDVCAQYFHVTTGDWPENLHVCIHGKDPVPPVLIRSCWWSDEDQTLLKYKIHELPRLSRIRARCKNHMVF